MKERIVDPDPVREPEAYKQALLGFLGDDDPLEVMAETPATFRRRTRGLGNEVLTRRPAPTEWSVNELLAHYFNAEVVYAFRWRVVLAQDNPTLIGYDQDAWTSLATPPFGPMLDTFEALRMANVTMLRATDRSQWDRAGQHEERGEESILLGVSLIAGHDRAHLRQLEQTLRVVVP